MPAIRWLTAIIAGLAITLSLVFSLLLETKIEEEIFPMVTGGFVGMTAIGIVFFIRLDVRMDRENIQYKLWPLEWKQRSIKVDDIAEMEILKFKWMPGYGGFGKRRRFWKKQISYIMNNKCGLLIKLKNGKSVVLSIENEKKLRQFIQSSYPGLQVANL